MKRRYYDVIVSLGRNCEISFQLKRYFGFLDSYLFSWTFIDEYSKLAECLGNNFSELLDGELKEEISSNMWKCQKYLIAFHGRRKPAELLDKNGKSSPIQKQKEIAELISRKNHLVNKMRQLFLSNKKKLFIATFRLEHPENAVEESRGLQQLYEELCRCCTTFDLCIILLPGDEQYFTALASKDNVFLRYLNYFAPRSDVTNIKRSDYRSWNRIFREFRLLSLPPDSWRHRNLHPCAPKLFRKLENFFLRHENKY